MICLCCGKPIKMKKLPPAAGITPASNISLELPDYLKSPFKRSIRMDCK